MKKEIFCTLGPKTLNKRFLKFANGKVDLLRLNMSHLSLSQLKKNILFIKKYSKIPICLDTEGDQIRSKVKSKIFFKKNKNCIISKNGGYFNLYPDIVFNKIKKKDILNIGFNNLKVQIKNKNKKKMNCKVLSEGLLESNKGIHLINRKIRLNFITKKDKEAIQIAKENNIENFALSFTKSLSDVKRFNKILPKARKIFKIETFSAIRSFKKILKEGEEFLIDRGDLSKDTSIPDVPFLQRKIFTMCKKNKNKKVFVATNFLESMIKNPYPTQAEVNDIYTCLSLGADGLVLAAETAIGKHPEKCVNFLITMNKKKLIKQKRF